MNSQSGLTFEKVFAFYGKLSPEGFLLELKGKIFANNESLPDADLLVGHKFSETVFWQSASYVAENLQHAIDEVARGAPQSIELDFRLSAQDIVVVDLHLTPQIDDTGQVQSILFAAYDVSPRAREIKFYKDRSEQFLYAVENADIGLWFWDFKKNEIFSTPKCNEFFGLGQNEIITENYLIDAIHPEDRERVTAEIEESRSKGKIYDTEFRIVCPDGSVQWLAARGRTFFDENNTPQTMMGIVRKITDRKIADEELKRIYALEKKARDEAEEANRAKDYFLAIVSHELRSPLNSILGWTKILLTKNVDEPTRKNALETIERSAKSQAKLIEDLVDMARVASGKLRLELRPVNLFDIVSNVYNQQKPLAESKHINFEFLHNADRAEVFGDSIRLQQVFTNLINNALKFTPEGGAIKIDLKADPNKVEVNISDTGQGIAPDFLPNIFRQFAQAGKSSNDKSGLGLGLSIAKTLVEKHNGLIRVHSDGVGKGATFTVAFPLHITTTDSKRPRETAMHRTLDEPKLKNIRILLVEDDQDSRDVLALYLEQCGATIQGAESADEAMNYLLSGDGPKRYDLIISDLAMPIEDGYSFLNRVRSMPEDKGGKIPALALSAFTTKENRERAYEAGFQGYHTKPFEPDLLIREILQLVKVKR